FQNFIIFTNYQFYIDGFCEKARRMIAAGEGGYESFVEPGNVVTLAGQKRPTTGAPPTRLPQMPAYHLTLPRHAGLTMVNIGIGPIATVDNRNWELGNQAEAVRRFSQSRAIALDMESATIAANGFRFRVPYGTLLCVSDKPLHGELKLPGMASEFYRRQVGQHLEIGLKALERLKQQESERLHSRKLRRFAEVAF